MPNLSQADVELRFQQSDSFWNILSQIQKGAGTLDAANTLLNQTYGKPQAAQVSLLYQPHAIHWDGFDLRELRVDALGYAISSNPVLPHLFGWAGYGPQLTGAWKWLEVYGGRFKGKRANAASTDLIDRSLIESEDLSFFGFGGHALFDLNQLPSLPSQLEIKTRTTEFISNSGESIWHNRWRVQATTDFSKLLVSDWFQTSGILIAGPQPVPGFENQSLVWDYLWNIYPFPDFLSAVGVGAKVEVLPWHIEAQGGFYGGYPGLELGYHPFEHFSIRASTYGIETSAAYQAQGIRIYGASLVFN